MSRRKSRKKEKQKTPSSAIRRLTRGTGASTVWRGRAGGGVSAPTVAVGFRCGSVLVLQQSQTPSATRWCVFLKACKLLCLLHPALSVSFHFSPFLSFSPWDGCTLTDTAVSSSGVGPYCTVLSGPSPWELNLLLARGYRVCSQRHCPEQQRDSAARLALPLLWMVLQETSLV